MNNHKKHLFSFRKLLFPLILALIISCFLSCTDHGNQNESVVITGSIENSIDDFVEFYVGDTTVTAHLVDDIFKSSIPLSGATYAKFKHGHESGPLYLQPNQDFNLTLNTEEFDETLKFTGDGAGPNNYLISKFLMNEGMLKNDELYIKDESDFKKTIHDAKTKAVDQLNKMDNEYKLPDNFNAIEKAKIDYWASGYLGYYQKGHRKYSKNPEFKVSDNYFDYEDDLDWNNETYITDVEFFVSYIKQYSYRYANSPEKSEYPNYQNAFNAVESKISNKKVLDFAYKNIMIMALQDGVNDKDSELIEIFNEKCKNTEYLSAIQDRYDKLMMVAEGKQAPGFKYNKVNGEEVALEDLRGKIVYIDVWATWCAPCRKELPHLEKLQEKYKNEDIHFVSLSVDKDKSAWKKMVTNKEMKGIQLIADKAFDSSICQDYLIKGIPRFILIHKNGKLVDYNAPRPSSEEIEPLLKELLQS